jgi:hypothetical protein
MHTILSVFGGVGESEKVNQNIRKIGDGTIGCHFGRTMMRAPPLAAKVWM